MTLLRKINPPIALSTRAPFESMVSSMKEWIKATNDKKIADEKLIESEKKLSVARKKLEISKSANSN